MILIKQPLLTNIMLAHYEGVPVCALIRKHHLPITPPTLAKLINYMSMAKDSQIADDAKQRILASLFPDWLIPLEGSVHTQEPNWHYKGRMPFGEWQYKEWTDK